MKRLEDLSEQDLSLDEITAVVDNSDLWLKFSENVDLAKHREPVSDEDLKLVMVIVMISVTLVSYSRPSAIANCTVDEYRNAVTCEGSTIIKVHSHKTGSKGSAKLTIDEHLTDRLRLYFTYIRPLLIDQGHDIPNLFILPGSKKIDNFSNLHSFLKKHLAIDIPSATKARKIGATCAARSLDYQTNSLVTKQMSHDPDVSRRYYEALQGPSDAAFAFQQMEALRKGESTSRVQYAPVLSQESSQSTPKPTTPAPSSRWTPRDTVFIQEKFARYIKNGKTPNARTWDWASLQSKSKTKSGH